MEKKSLYQRGIAIYEKIGDTDIQDIINDFRFQEIKIQQQKAIKEICEVMTETVKVFTLWREEPFPYNNVSEITSVYEFKKYNISLSKKYGHFCSSCIPCDNCIKSNNDVFHTTCCRSFKGNPCDKCHIWVCSRCRFKDGDRFLCPECTLEL